MMASAAVSRGSNSRVTTGVEKSLDGKGNKPSLSIAILPTNEGRSVTEGVPPLTPQSPDTPYSSTRTKLPVLKAKRGKIEKGAEDTDKQLHSLPRSSTVSEERKAHTAVLEGLSSNAIAHIGTTFDLLGRLAEMAPALEAAEMVMHQSSLLSANFFIDRAFVAAKT